MKADRDPEDRNPAPVEIFTDGACQGNPGPGGWGVLLHLPDGNQELKGGLRLTTNNRMELTAALMALEAIDVETPVVIHTDSQYVRNGMTNWIHNWKRRGWKTAANQPVKNADLWSRLNEATQHRQVTWKWVRGHAGNAGNERADQLAREGMREALLSSPALETDSSGVARHGADENPPANGSPSLHSTDAVRTYESMKADRDPEDRIPAPVEIFTDGACQGNPGPGGWGVLLHLPDGDQELKGGLRLTTNNRMELTAALMALEAIDVDTPVVIHTDSQYVRNGMTNWIYNWKRRGWKTAANEPVKNADLWSRLNEAAQHRQVTWKWVRGHAGNAGNERADQLAREGMKEALLNSR